MTTAHAPAGWYADPSGAPGLRWFDGTDWDFSVTPAQPPVIQAPVIEADWTDDEDDEPRILSDAQRCSRLDVIVARGVREGWHVESRSPTQAVLTRGRDASNGVHVFHLVMTVLTLGFWVFVWILYAMSRHQERFTFTVDLYGNITES